VMSVAVKLATLLIGAAALYAKGYQDGERLGRLSGTIEGRWSGIADLTRVLEEAKRRRG
jgi:hypothetical protein